MGTLMLHACKTSDRVIGKDDGGTRYKTFPRTTPRTHVNEPIVKTLAKLGLVLWLDLGKAHDGS